MGDLEAGSGSAFRVFAGEEGGPAGVATVESLTVSESGSTDLFGLAVTALPAGGGSQARLYTGDPGASAGGLVSGVVYAYDGAARAATLPSPFGADGGLFGYAIASAASATFEETVFQ